MKPSQTVLLSAVGVFTLVMLVMAGLGRVALSQTDSGTTRTAAGSAIVENGRITETFDLEAFQEVSIEGQWRVNLTQGDEWRVEVSHAENLEDEVNVYIRGNRLVLERNSSGIWRWWSRMG